MQEIRIKTPTMQSKITIGLGAFEKHMPRLIKGQKNFALVDKNVYKLYADKIDKYFSADEIYLLPSGERNKSLSRLCQILEEMQKRGLRRSSRLFAIGGGVVGDIGGLCAALYMRGISCVQVPTTLLAQVDSSVGGKTAVNVGGVKNNVGAFYQPCEVLVDGSFLKTLPKREWKCGLGEIIKYAALNKEIFHALDKKTAKQLLDEQFIEGLVFSCIAHKAKVVEMDEKELGARASLNVGHTTGHIIELQSGLSHGESVLLGMWIETQIAINEGVCEKEYGEKLLQIIKTGLFLTPKNTYTFENLSVLAEKAKQDKKNREDGKIVLALPKKEGEWHAYAMHFKDYQTALISARSFR